MDEKQMIIGYTTGVYDLFHVGHLNLLKNAKGMCDKLIVGVTIDELVTYKGKHAMIPFEDRIEIVRNIQYVDAAVPQYDMDKLSMCKKLGATILFVGDDWYGTEKWQEYEKAFGEAGIKIIYFPYTHGVSSTKINDALNNLQQDNSNKNKHIVNKEFCMSSYMAFRYIEKEGVDFYDSTYHENFKPALISEMTYVSTPQQIDEAINNVFVPLKKERLGILLSGGMDSAILASYMSGSDAYTFRFAEGKFQSEELQRAEFYAEYYRLNLHYVDIDWDVVEKHIDSLMLAKGGPVHSIEPQILHAALQARTDGVQRMIVGESADLIFGGMDGLLAQDWNIEDFIKRYTFTNPQDVLKNPVDMRYLFERYRMGNKIDFLKFMDEVFSIESSGSYLNAFGVAGMPYTDPYAKLKMAIPLDLHKVRNGESKYLIRQLFAMKYPEYPVPNKIPMPRPVDEYFKDYTGPIRQEFREDIDLSKLTGNQKWQIWCLERFLNLMDSKNAE